MADKTWMAEATAEPSGKPVAIWHQVPLPVMGGKAQGACGTIFRPTGSKSGLGVSLAAPKCIVCAQS